METDGYDPFADLFSTRRPERQAQIIQSGNSSGGWGGIGNGGGGIQYFTIGGGGGGGAGIAHGTARIEYKPEPTEEERQEMNWTNNEAAEIAQEILSEERKEGLREKVTAAVAHFREMLEGASCGSVFTFRKENTDGQHYWYAAIKSGKMWYTTANQPRVLEGDDALISWLISLEAYDAPGLALSAGEAGMMELAGPIDATASE